MREGTVVPGPQRIERTAGVGRPRKHDSGNEIILGCRFQVRRSVIRRNVGGGRASKQLRINESREAAIVTGNCAERGAVAQGRTREHQRSRSLGEPALGNQAIDLLFIEDHQSLI